MSEKIRIVFKEYVSHRPTSHMPKGFRTYSAQLIESFIQDLVDKNGGLSIKEYDDYYGDGQDVRPVYDYENRNYSVLDGRIFVDWVNKVVIADADLKINLIIVGELWTVKDTPRVKRAPKLETKATHVDRSTGYETEYADEEKTKVISFKDRYSWKCAQCGKIYGYRTEAHNCSLSHIEYGKIEGDNTEFESVSNLKAEEITA